MSENGQRGLVFDPHSPDLPPERAYRLYAQLRAGCPVSRVASVARMGAPGFAHYVASKAAVDGLTRAAARELGPDGITVNAVAPGPVSDEATRTLNSDGYIAAAAGDGRWVARWSPTISSVPCCSLASEAGGFVSGQTLIIDGGGVFT